MKRKEFVKKGLLAGVAGSLGAVACNSESQSAQIDVPNINFNKTYKWRMVTTWPPNFPVVGDACSELSKWVSDMSAGRMEIQVYGGGELVPPLEVFDAVSSGAVELGHGAAYYWAGIEQAFQFFTSVPFGMNAQQINAWMEAGGGHELWTEIYQDFNLVPFYAGNTGAQMGGWFNRRIDSIDDFKGLKMRMPGLGGKVLERVGATAVLSAGSELYTNLERGVIDATEWIGPYHDYLMGFHDIAKYYYTPGWHETGSLLELIVNKRDYESLPSDLKAILKTAAYRSNAYVLSHFEAKNNEYLVKILEESDVELLQFPDEVIAELKKITLEIYEELVAADPLSQRVYEAFTQFKKGITDWSQLSERVFYNTIQ